MNDFYEYLVPGNICRDHFRADTAELFRAQTEAVVLQAGVSIPQNASHETIN